MTDRASPHRAKLVRRLLRESKNTRIIMATSRTLNISAQPDTHGTWQASQVPGMDLAIYNDPQNPEPV